MLRSYVLTLYRSLTRHKLYSALNVLGLAVGIAAFLVLMLAVRFEHSYDRWIPGADDIYRVDSTYTFPGTEAGVSAASPGLLMRLMRADFPQIDQAVRLMPTRTAVQRDERSEYEDLVFADRSFFDVFDLPLSAGSRDALSNPTGLVLTESTARKYFGDQPALGRTLTLVVEGQPRTYTVGAVLRDLPENTHLEFAAVAPLQEALFADSQFESWNNIFLYTYVRIPNAADRQAVQASLDAFVNRHGREVGPKPTDLLRLKLQPLPDIHFADVAVNGSFRPGVDRLFVWTLALVAATALFIAAVNYVNLSTARAGLRAREVALRKVMGATRGALLIQFLTESVLVTALAATLGLALAELALPAARAALGVDLRLSYLGPEGFVPLLAGLVLLIGVGAGLYPALVLARFEPAGVLAASRSGGGGRASARIREALVALQFAVSIAMIVCTAVIYAQTNFIRNADLGYQREGLMIVAGLEEVESRIVPLYRAFGEVPGVAGLTLSTRSPGDGEVLTALVTRPGLGGRERDMPYERTGPDYFRTYGIRIVAGRDFDPANRADDLAGANMSEVKERGLNLLLNERGARLLGYRTPSEAVGATVRVGSIPARVVGVAADTRFGSPREPVAPMFYLRDTDTARFAIIRYRGEPQAVRAGLESAWRRIAPATPFEAETVEQTLNSFYEPDERRSRLFAAGAVLAVAIGCIGLYGLGAFTAGRRTKEIGIRKVLGAGTADVLRLLLVQFLRPVVLANLLAWPMAFVLMRAWLSGFDQQIMLSPAYFALATALAFVVALSTVIFQALQAARANPIEALRHE